MARTPLLRKRSLSVIVTQQDYWIVKAKPRQWLAYFGGLDIESHPLYVEEERAVKFGSREAAVACAQLVFGGRALLVHREAVMTRRRA